MGNPAGRSNYNTGGFWRRRSNHFSWEELAFAEDDAAGSLWPPRSYTCSFCRREFKSAQALGGHMNVHRRDRARLKQAENHRKDNQSKSERAASSYTLVFSPNPKKSERSCVIDLASSSSSSASLTSRVLSLSRKQGTTPQEISPFPPSLYSSPSSSPFVLERSKNVKKLLSKALISKGDNRKRIERDVSESGCKAKLGFVCNTDPSVSLNLMTHRSLPVANGGDRDEDGEIYMSCKRRRQHESLSQPFISNPSLSCKNDKVIQTNEEIRTNPLEDLDLELRLGADPPKVISPTSCLKESEKEQE